MTHKCPPRNELVDFAGGKVSNVRRHVQIEAHLERCPECLTVVEEQPSPFVDALRSNQPDQAHAREAGCDSALARALAIYPANEDSAIESETIERASADDAFPMGAKDQRLGTSLGRFEIVSRLGAGGMGVVYHAIDQETRQSVALKLMHNSRADSATSVARFRRERNAVQRLSHPNIVAAHDTGIVDDTHYLAMELIHGVDVAQLSQISKPMGTAEACEIIRQAASGLVCIDQHGLVHRDLKPANLMLTLSKDESVVVKILDLGLAFLESSRSTDSFGFDSITSLSQLMGTIDYMSPEQCLDSHAVDIRSDIFSLGATLYRMLAGKSLWSGQAYPSTGRKLKAILTDPIPSIRTQRHDLDPGIAAVVDRMLRRDPEERFQTPMSVVEALTPYAANHKLAALLHETTSIVQSQRDTLAESSLTKRDASPVKKTSFRSALIVGCLLTAVVFGWLMYRLPAERSSAIQGRTLESNSRTKIVEPLLGIRVANNKSSKGLTGRLISPAWQWSLPINAGPVVNDSRAQTHVSLSSDGLLMCVMDDESSLRLLSRESLRDPFEESDLLPDLGNAVWRTPRITPNGLSLFHSAQVDGQLDLFLYQRRSRDERFSSSFVLGSDVNTPADEQCPALGAHSQLAYVSSSQSKFMGSNIWIGNRRSGVSFPVNSLNSDHDEMNPSLSVDGDVIVFNRFQSGEYRGTWMSIRNESDDHFGDPIEVDIPGVSECTTPFLAANGQTLIFSAQRELGYGDHDVWISHRIKRSAPSNDKVRVAHEAPPRDPDLSRGLLTWLSFDEASGEQIPNRLSERPAAKASFSTKGRLVQGAPGNDLAIRVKDHGDHVEVGRDSSMENRNAMTLGVWMRVDPIVGGALAKIVDQSTDHQGYFLKLVIAGSASNKLMFNERTGGKRRKPLVVDKIVADGAWHHVVVCLESQFMKMYLDGKLCSESARKNEVMEPNDLPLKIGNGDTSLELDFDEFCLYDRALSEEEVHALSTWRPGLSMPDPADVESRAANSGWSEPVLVRLPADSPGKKFALSADQCELLAVSNIQPVTLLSYRRASIDETWNFDEEYPLKMNFASVYGPFLSSDGLTLLFNARTEKAATANIWECRRASHGEAWSVPQPLPYPISTEFNEGGPCLSDDGLALWFDSDREGGFGGTDIWMSRRTSRDSDWSMPVNLGEQINGAKRDAGPCVSADGKTLAFFSSSRTGNYDITLATRDAVDDPWSQPMVLPSPVNTKQPETEPELSADGRTIFFSSGRIGKDRIYWSTRQ